MAEADAVGEVGEGVVGEPSFEVVGFGPGGWSVAVWPDAAAVACSHGGALCLGEEALFSADVERFSGGAEQDAEVAGVAELSFDGGEGDRGGASLDVPVAGHGFGARSGRDRRRD